MSDRFSAAIGRKVVSRQSAEQLGNVTHLLVDATSRRVVALTVGKGRRARLVDWSRLSGLGPDAAIVDAEDAVREPADEREQAAAQGKLELLGKRAMQETGQELGEINDVTFDPDTGKLEMLLIGSTEQPASSLLGAGSYAVILSADTFGA